MQKTAKKVELKTFFFFRKGDWDLHIYKCKQNSHSKPQKMTQNIRKPLSLPPSLKGKKKNRDLHNIFKTPKVTKNLKAPSLQNKMFSVRLSGVQVEVHEAKNN